MRAIVIRATPEGAAEEAARRIARAVRAARAERGVAHLALAGGATPRRTYELLGPLVGDWDGIQLWFGDERAVPPEDPRSNYRMVRESLLSGARIPPEQVHRIRGELPPAEAAEAYAAELRRHVASGADGIPVLDVALLGLGEDGHTASLFPGDPLIEARGLLCRAVRAPVPPRDRVTLTLDVLCAARCVLLLAIGAGKARAVRAVLCGPDPRVPASLLAEGATTLIADAAAAGAGEGA